LTLSSTRNVAADPKLWVQATVCVDPMGQVAAALGDVTMSKGAIIVYVLSSKA
jgi:hypothetical protein